MSTAATVKIVFTYNFLIGLDIPSRYMPGSVERNVFENLLDVTLRIDNTRNKILYIIREEQKKIDRVLRGDLYKSVLPSRDYALEIKNLVEICTIDIGHQNAWFLLAKQLKIVDENVVQNVII